MVKVDILKYTMYDKRPIKGGTMQNKTNIPDSLRVNLYAEVRYALCSCEKPLKDVLYSHIRLFGYDEIRELISFYGEQDLLGRFENFYQENIVQKCSSHRESQVYEIISDLDSVESLGQVARSSVSHIHPCSSGSPTSLVSQTTL